MPALTYRNLTPAQRAFLADIVRQEYDALAVELFGAQVLTPERLAFLVRIGVIDPLKLRDHLPLFDGAYGLGQMLAAAAGHNTGRVRFASRPTAPTERRPAPTIARPAPGLPAEVHPWPEWDDAGRVPEPVEAPAPGRPPVPHPGRVEAPAPRHEHPAPGPAPAPRTPPAEAPHVEHGPTPAPPGSSDAPPRGPLEPDGPPPPMDPPPPGGGSGGGSGGDGGGDPPGGGGGEPPDDGDDPVLGQRKRQIDAARQRGGRMIVGLGNKLGDNLETVLISSDSEEAQERRRRVREAVAEGMRLGESLSQIRGRVAEMALDDDHARDVDRIVATEVHAAVNEGFIETARALGDGDDTQIAILLSRAPCKRCQVLYAPGGKPRVFKVGDLPKWGANFRRKVEDWVATAPPLHPNCACSAIYVPPGWGVEPDGTLVPPAKKATETAEDTGAGPPGDS